MTPAEVDQCSFWQFRASVAGWNQAHGAVKAEPPSNAEFDEMVERHNAQ